MKRMTLFSIGSGSLGLLSLLAFLIVGAADAHAGSRKNFTLEVAQDGSTSAFNAADEPGPPSVRGSSGVINGPIFKAGDLSDPYAEPIGTWRCAFNVLAVDPDDPTRIAAATYYFVLDGKNGRKPSMLIVSGLNRHFFPDSEETEMVVVGGTGKYKNVTGVVVEEVLGTNETGALDLRYRFRLQKGDDDD